MIMTNINAQKYEVWVGDLNSLYDFEIGLAPYSPVCHDKCETLEQARKLREETQDYQTAAWIRNSETGELVL